MTLLRNGAWKGTVVGALLAGLPMLGWQIYHGTTTQHGVQHEQEAGEIRDEATRWALVLKHIEETEPLKADYMSTKQQVMLNAQAISVIQTGMAAMQDDFRAVRDYIYGRRPGEPTRR